MHKSHNIMSCSSCTMIEGITHLRRGRTQVWILTQRQQSTGISIIRSSALLDKRFKLLWGHQVNYPDWSSKHMLYQASLSYALLTRQTRLNIWMMLHNGFAHNIFPASPKKTISPPLQTATCVHTSDLYLFGVTPHGRQPNKVSVFPSWISILNPREMNFSILIYSDLYSCFGEKLRKDLVQNRDISG